MSGSHHDDELILREIELANQRDDGLDDEEKILAGRIDVNMPALLTRDVQGG